MDRRRFVLGAAAACPLCVSAAHAASWSYEGSRGPDKWGSLSRSYRACETGNEQSPIDLTNAISADVDAPLVEWASVRLGSVVNNGHTIQVNTPGAGQLSLDGRAYELLQFHFHHQSEHTVNGYRYPLEVHFVHKEMNGDNLAVIGVFFEEGDANEVLSTIWRVMPETKGEGTSEAVIDPNGLLPKTGRIRGRSGDDVFRYAGSLTTPPCSEIVQWTVYKTPIGASADQIAAFAKLFPGNFRPVQPVNRRFILLGK